MCDIGKEEEGIYKETNDFKINIEFSECEFKAMWHGYSTTLIWRFSIIRFVDFKSVSRF